MLDLFINKYPVFFDNFNKINYNRELIEESKEHKTIYVIDKNFGKIKIAKPRNPLRDARLDLKQCDVRNGELTIVGFGLGYHIKILLEEYNLTKLEIIVLNSDVFKWALENTPGIQEIINDKRVFFKALDFKTTISNLETNLFIHLESAMLFPNEFIRTALLQIRLQKAGGANNILVPDFHEKENIKNIKKYFPVKQLFNSNKNKTAYILGAGPSLDDYIDFFKNLDDENSIVIVCNTVLTKLITNNISYDYITLIEMLDKVIENFDKVSDSKKPLISYIYSHSKVLSSYLGKVYVAYHKDSKNKKLDLGELHSKGNVIHLSTTLAIAMGCNKIRFCGVDFAFSKGMKYGNGVSSNTKFDKKYYEKLEVLKVKGIESEEVYTSLPYNLPRIYLEQIINENPQIEFENMGLCGAKINGATQINMLEM